MIENLFVVSNQSFNIASLLYAFAFFNYCVQLISEKSVWEKTASYLGRLAFLFHTLALLVRWYDAGIGHPPWTNLYESLVFFSWGVMGAHLLLEWRRNFKMTGVFASAVVFVAMGVASLHPSKEIEPLVPALQSWWLLFHVFMACIAYAFFLASSFVAVFYLMKEGVKKEWFAVGATVCALVFLPIAAGKHFFTEFNFNFFKVSRVVEERSGTLSGDVRAVEREVIMNFKGPDGKPVQEFVAIPGGAPLMAMVLWAYLISGIVFVRGLRRRDASSVENWGWRLFGFALLAHGGLLALIAYAASSHEGLSIKSNPYKLAALLMTFGVSCLFFVYRFVKTRLVRRLPNLEVLDRYSYEAILIGVPFMTINLISGAVWAYYAWGRYWGWDPKETWALITWFIYLIYLHLRVLGGWKGRRTALLSVFGFFVVVFTYLGVNLVISGLHSYATG